MSYLLKVDSKEYSKYKNKKKKEKSQYSLKFRVNCWVVLLSEKKKFDELMNNINRDDLIRDKTDVTAYKIIFEEKTNWMLFLNNCKHHEIYASDLLNYLLKKYNKEGALFEHTIKV